MEIAPQQAKLPELIGNVLADIGHGSVRSDDDFLALFDVRLGVRVGCLVVIRVVRLGFRRFRVLDRHDPAALEAPLGLEEHRLSRLELLERRRPEMQAKDVALPREEIVVDVDSRHRPEMRPHDPVGDQRAHLSEWIPALFERVQHVGAFFETRLVGLIPFGHPRVEIPAVVIEPFGAGIGQRPHVLETEVFECREPHDDVGHLNTGVVYVVLNLDRMAEEPEGTHGVPRAALRKCPIWAALLGLMAVCSTMTFGLSRGLPVRTAGELRLEEPARSRKN